MFGAGALYNSLLYGFLVGAILPIPFFLLRKKYKLFEYVHIPVLLTGGLVWYVDHWMADVASYSPYVFHAQVAL
jgi:hypothetical protein